MRRPVGLNKRGRVFVELGADGRATRIIKILSYSPHDPEVHEMSRKQAVEDIRRQVFERAGGTCERCAAQRITWDSMHLHEQVHRGKGGEVSVENSVALCARCHISPVGEHANRFPQWSRK